MLISGLQWLLTNELTILYATSMSCEMYQINVPISCYYIGLIQQAHNIGPVSVCPTLAAQTITRQVPVTAIVLIGTSLIANSQHNLTIIFRCICVRQSEHDYFEYVQTPSDCHRLS